MKTLSLPNGDAIPALGLGTWKARPGEVGAAVEAAIRIGYRHIDCATVYANEVEVGEAIAKCIAEGVVRREQLWITSKLWNDAHAPADVAPALDKSLADLGLDYLDLYLVHWPVISRPGVVVARAAEDLLSPDEVPLSSTWTALERCVEAGKCRHIGVSNFSVAKLGALIEGARIKPACNQVELHPYLQQPQLLDFCRAQGVIATAYSPLGSPDRPSIFRKQDEPRLLDDPTLAAIAKRHGCSVARVALAWALRRGTSVIPKSINPERMADNLAALELELDADDMQRIADLDRARRYVDGEFFCMPGSPYTLASLWDE